ncbi:hypothetical protein PAUR_a0925 [Pseudoalteromonas aurantia 208]|uniref:Uncharacterized protein n=1 Tax=Pseudoalteromonas aurantia 208 TaxID=1314867 RepID=A0ABR9ECR5_9GAMM|nr:hypothetical protein [Pseudoalteromonas aurantia 208]
MLTKTAMHGGQLFSPLNMTSSYFLLKNIKSNFFIIVIAL